MPFRNIYPPRNNWEKAQFWLAWLSLGIWWAILAVLGIMAADRQEPITELKGRFLGWSEHSPRVGIVEWTGRRMRSCDGWSYRQVINGHVIDLTPIKITSYTLAPKDVGRIETWQVDFELPKDFDHNGNYRIRPEYYCNAFHRAVWPIMLTPDDVPFTLPHPGPEPLPPSLPRNAPQ